MENKQKWSTRRRGDQDERQKDKKGSARTRGGTARIENITRTATEVQEGICLRPTNVRKYANHCEGFCFRYGSGSCWLRRRREEEGGRGRKLAN
jgi:hypothetical protein